MKKLSAILLTMALTLSVFAFAGCAPSTFDGNYTERSAEDIATLNEAIEDANASSTVNYARGVSFVIDMDMEVSATYGTTTANMVADMNMDLKASGQDLASVKMAGTMDMTMEMTGPYNQSAEIDAEVYYTDGYMYTKMGDVKEKVQASLDDVTSTETGTMIDEILGTMPSTDSDLGDILAFFGELDSVKYYTDINADTTKIKLTFNETASEEGEGVMQGEIYFVYDSETYELLALKMDYTINATYSGTNVALDMSAVIDSWSGTVSLPNDLDTYGAN